MHARPTYDPPLRHVPRDSGFLCFSYIAAGLLLVIRDRVLCFWCLDVILRGESNLSGNSLGMADYFKDNGMQMVMTDMKVCRQLLSRYKILDDVAMMGGVEVPVMPYFDNQFLTPWLMTLFSGPKGLCDGMPSATLFRIWDCIFSEGIKVVFRVVLVLVRRSPCVVTAENQDEVMEECFSQLQEVIQDSYDHEELLKEAFSLSSFKRSTITELRSKHKKYRQ